VNGNTNNPPQFQTRSVVLIPNDLSLTSWPERAKQAGLTAIALHASNDLWQVSNFLRTGGGITFLRKCRELGLEIEYEHHAMRQLLPRDLYRLSDPTLFRMNFAPIGRRYDLPYAQQRGPNFQDTVDALDANLDVFDPDTTQILEYWLDASRFSGWKNQQLKYPGTSIFLPLIWALTAHAASGTSQRLPVSLMLNTSIGMASHLLMSMERAYPTGSHVRATSYDAGNRRPQPNMPEVSRQQRLAKSFTGIVSW